ncbi:MAG: hypothetical protein RL357_1677, partial [Pseudomonadota bacterium]
MSNWVHLASLACHTLLTMTLLSPALSWAQAGRDAGAIARDLERQQTRPGKPPGTPSALEPNATPEAPMSSQSEGPRFVIQRFDFIGLTLLSESELRRALDSWLGRELTFADLQKALTRVTDLYEEKGWTVRPQLPEQDVGDGVVTVQLIEGKLGEVAVVNEDTPISTQQIKGILTARQRPGDPLRIDALTRGLAVLNDLPGLSAQAALKPGADLGFSDVLAIVKPSPGLTGSVMADNFGAKSTGQLRITGSWSWNNPNHLGDQTQLSLMGSEGSIYGRLVYSRPIGFDGWRAQASHSQLQYSLLGEFSDLSASGLAVTNELGLTYPIKREAESNLTLSIDVTRSRYVNTEVEVRSQRELSFAALGLSGDQTDAWMGGGSNAFGINLTHGQATRVTDLCGCSPPTTQSFTALEFNGSRLQRLVGSTTLRVFFSGQLAANNLDSSQKFGLGGTNGVRAYAASEASLTMSGTTVSNREYDGSTHAAVTIGNESGYVSGESLTITAAATFDSKDAGNRT